MRLITTNQDIKKHFSSVSAGFEIESIESFLTDGIEQHIIPAVGRAFYAELIAALETVEPGSKLETAIFILQKAEVNFALGYFSNSGALEISDAGINVTKSDKRLPASDKKLMQFRRQCIADGYNALELAVDFLELNIADFATYGASDNHKINRCLFINSSRDFPQTLPVSAELFASLSSILANIEVEFIEPLLGEDVTDQLRAAILNNTLTDPQKDLLKRIRKVVGSRTLAEAIPYKLVNLDATGAYTYSDTVGGISGNVENRNPAELNRLQLSMNKLVNQSEADLESLRKWLNKHKEEFAGYEESTAASLASINTNPSSGLYFI
jgi:hypothetical protein